MFNLNDTREDMKNKYDKARHEKPSPIRWASGREVDELINNLTLVDLKNLPEKALFITTETPDIACDFTIVARGVNNSSRFASDPGEYPKFRLLSAEPEGLKDSNILGATQVALMQIGWVLNPYQIWDGTLIEKGYFQIRRDALDRFDG